MDKAEVDKARDEWLAKHIWGDGIDPSWVEQPWAKEGEPMLRRLRRFMYQLGHALGYGWIEKWIDR